MCRIVRFYLAIIITRKGGGLTYPAGRRYCCCDDYVKPFLGDTVLLLYTKKHNKERVTCSIYDDFIKAYLKSNTRMLCMCIRVIFVTLIPVIPFKLVRDIFICVSRFWFCPPVVVQYTRKGSILIMSGQNNNITFPENSCSRVNAKQKK